MSEDKINPQIDWRADACPTCNQPAFTCSGLTGRRTCRDGHQWAWVDGEPLMVVSDTPPENPELRTIPNSTNGDEDE